MKARTEHMWAIAVPNCPGFVEGTIQPTRSQAITRAVVNLYGPEAAERWNRKYHWEKVKRKWGWYACRVTITESKADDD